MLPTGEEVLALNGSADNEDAATASLNADLYNPTTNTFSSGRSECLSAMLYHSNLRYCFSLTLLVLVLGSNLHAGTYGSHMEDDCRPLTYFNADVLRMKPPGLSIHKRPLQVVIGYGVQFPSADAECSQHLFG